VIQLPAESIVLPGLGDGEFDAGQHLHLCFEQHQPEIRQPAGKLVVLVGLFKGVVVGLLMLSASASSVGRSRDWASAFPANTPVTILERGVYSKYRRAIPARISADRGETPFSAVRLNHGMKASVPPAMRSDGCAAKYTLGACTGPETTCIGSGCVRLAFWIAAAMAYCACSNDTCMIDPSTARGWLSIHPLT
jgi:hypothetical protein